MIPSLAQLWDLIVHRHRAYDRATEHAQALADDEEFGERHAETVRQLAAGELEEGISADEFRERYSIVNIEQVMNRYRGRRWRIRVIAGCSAAMLTALLFLFFDLGDGLVLVGWAVAAALVSALLAGRFAGRRSMKRRINWGDGAKKNRRYIWMLRFCLFWSLFWTGMDIGMGQHRWAMVQLNFGAFIAFINVMLYRWFTRDRRKLDDEARIVGALDFIEWRYAGLELSRASKVRVARLYPAIDRLERKKVIMAQWDESEPRKKYRRRMYRLTQPTDISG